MAERRFEDRPAKRERVPLLIGLVGPSGSGKTFSMLRLLKGIEAEVGGGFAVIDTEARRSLWYAEQFKDTKGEPFRHLDFQAPFGPLDYLGAIEHFKRQGIRNIGIDSMSHEHEGPGGVLEIHEAELDRLAGQDWQKRERVKFLAWAKPKAERRRLINAILQMDLNFVFCFRAKEKLKLERGKDPVNLGWQAIAGDEFIYEQTLNLLLPPAAKGVPDLAPKEIGEKATLKIPQQFAGLLRPGQPLDEALGAALARWAAGGVPNPAPRGDRPENGQPGGKKETLEAIGELLTRNLGDDRQARGDALQLAFGTPDRIAVSKLSTNELAAGLAVLRDNLEAGERMREPGEDAEEDL